MKSAILFFLFVTALSAHGFAQQADPVSKAGWISAGARSTLSAFDHDGAGLGTGG